MTDNSKSDTDTVTLAQATVVRSTVLIDRLVKEYVAPCLKEQGFRKDSLNFWRDAGDVIDVVTIQKSQWNGPLSSSFTIELGLYWKGIQRDLCYLSGMDKPKAWDCLIRERIGAILDGKDLWWDLTPETDVKAIGLDVLNKVNSTALPWLVAGHNLAVSLRYVSVSHGPAHSDAFKAVLEGRPITPLVPPARKGFLVVDGNEYDMRTKESRKVYDQGMRKRPSLVRFAGSDTSYDLNSKESKKALKKHVERTNKIE